MSLKKLLSNDAVYQGLRHQVLKHPVYDAVKSKQHLKLFMESHSFAVYDFMVLIKSIETCVTRWAPLRPIGFWAPPQDPILARLIKDIVLCEECDEVRPGKIISHYELYLEAMREINANSDPIQCFVGELMSGKTLDVALNNPIVQFAEPAAIQHTRTTLELSQRGSLPAMLGSFCLAREEPIPAMFEKLLPRIGHDAPSMRLYLERHIQVDADDHGPKAEAALELVAAQQRGNSDILLNAAKQALAARVSLWDGIVQAIARQDAALPT